MAKRRHLPLRNRAASTFDEIDRRDALPPLDGARQLIQIANLGAMPSTAGLYFAAHPVSMTGFETEGGTASLSVSSQIIYPLIVGRRAPVAGDILVARGVGTRWVAQKSGVSGPVCQPCSTPQDGSDNESVSWTLANVLGYFSQINGATLYCQQCLTSFGLFCATLTCFAPFSNPTSSCLAFGCNVPGASSSIGVTATSFTNPLTFTLSQIGSYVGSPVVSLCSQTGGLQCNAVTLTYYVQCWKVCNYSGHPNGTTYLLQFARRKSTDAAPTQIGPFPYLGVVASGWPHAPFDASGTFDSFDFPADGSSGVVSCSPLLLSLSHSIGLPVALNTCGLTGTYTNSITVSA